MALNWIEVNCGNLGGRRWTAAAPAIVETLAWEGSGRWDGRGVWQLVRPFQRPHGRALRSVGAAALFESWRTNMYQWKFMIIHIHDIESSYDIDNWSNRDWIWESMKVDNDKVDMKIT